MNNPSIIDVFRDVKQDSINIDDLEILLDHHDCHMTPEDSCECSQLYPEID